MRTIFTQQLLDYFELKVSMVLGRARLLALWWHSIYALNMQGEWLIDPNRDTYLVLRFWVLVLNLPTWILGRRRLLIRRKIWVRVLLIAILLLLRRLNWIVMAPKRFETIQKSLQLVVKLAYLMWQVLILSSQTGDSRVTSMITWLTLKLKWSLLVFLFRISPELTATCVHFVLLN